MTPPVAWLILAHSIPRQPSAPRVGIWRKLRHLGAILMHDAVWVLPRTEATEEQFRWLHGEILEAGGRAHIWIAQSAWPADDTEWIARFQSEVEGEYRDILKQVKRGGADRHWLARRFSRIQERDYFHSPFAKTVRRALLESKPEGNA